MNSELLTKPLTLKEMWEEVRQTIPASFSKDVIEKDLKLAWYTGAMMAFSAIRLHALAAPTEEDGLKYIEAIQGELVLISLEVAKAKTV